jgi:hypothetical protein
MSEEGLLTADNPASTTTEATGSWKDGVDSGLRYSADGNDKLARFDTEASLAKSYLELEKMDSGKVKMPGDESTPEEKSAFYQKLGTPEAVDGYELPELAEGEAYDEQMMGAIKNYALENNIPKDMFSGMVGIYMQEANAAMERQATATQDSLKQEWAGDYDKNVEISRRALRELAPEEITEPLIAEISRMNLDNSEPFIKFLHSVGSKMMDDTLVKGDAVPSKDDYIPKYINSPSMYRSMEGPEGEQARAYFDKNSIAY